MKIRTASRNSFKKILQEKMEQMEQEMEKKPAPKKEAPPALKLDSKTLSELEDEIGRYYFDSMIRLESRDKESN